MKPAARLLGLAAVCAAPLFAGALAEPASAQGESCKADTVTTSGRGKFRPFSKQKELAGEGAAMRDAVANWEKQVASSFGEEWKKWSSAKDTSFDCGITQGKILSNLVACTISGRPCLTTAAAPGPGKVVEVEKEKGPVRRPRNNGRPITPEDRIVRHEDRVYERAMARQRHLEEERKRAETASYEREMARQKYLAEQRSREEAAAWEREDARQRYLAEQRKRIERSYDRGPWSDDD
jgi:hypothetical protein